MRTIFVFDAAENDIIGINEASVIKNTGVSVENIKRTVMKAVGKSKRPAVRIRKKTVFSFIAATAAIAVIGMATVGATGGFNSTFSEFFAGEAAHGVYSGKDIKLSSSKVDIDFAGIAGDDDQVVAMMTLKKKDGTPFVRTVENTYIDQYDWSNVNMLGSENAYRVETEQTMWDKMMGTQSMDFGDIMYSFKDEGAINALVTCTNNNVSLKGRRLLVSDEKIYAFTNIKTLYTPKDGDGYSKYVTAEDGTKYMSVEGSILEEMTEKYKDTLKDGQVIMFNRSNDDMSVVIAERTELEIDLDIGVTLNYKNTTRGLDEAADKSYEIGGTEWTVDYIKAKSFTFEIRSHCDDLSSIEDRGSFERSFFPHDITVKLSDGSIYHAVEKRVLGSNGSYSYDGSFGEIDLIYSYTDADGNTAALDPSEIVSVELYGQKLM